MKLNNKYDREALIKILENLNEDLFIDKNDVADIINKANKALEDSDKIIMDEYIKNYILINTSNFDSEIKAKGDIEDKILNFSEGFEKYKEIINSEYKRLVDKRINALEVLNVMSKLSYPYSDILYMKYYNKDSINKIMGSLYISRSTYFRYLEMGIDLLLNTDN